MYGVWMLLRAKMGGAALGPCPPGYLPQPLAPFSRTLQHPDQNSQYPVQGIRLTQPGHQGPGLGLPANPGASLCAWANVSPFPFSSPLAHPSFPRSASSPGIGICGLLLQPQPIVIHLCPHSEPCLLSAHQGVPLISLGSGLIPQVQVLPAPPIPEDQELSSRCLKFLSHGLEVVCLSSPPRSTLTA